MGLINKFTICPSANFKEELKSIIYHIRVRLKEPLVAEKLYNNIVKKISSLSFMPERYTRIYSSKDKTRNIRKLPVNNYLIIYEINKNTGQVFILHIFHCSQDYILILYN